MRIVYAFPEPLPLRHARGVQVAHAVVELARRGTFVDLVYVPPEDKALVGTHPIEYYGLQAPIPLHLTALSRSLPGPLARALPRVHSNRFYLGRLERHLAELQRGGRRRDDKLVLMARHLKLAAMLAARFPDIPLVYEAHEVFGDTAPPRNREQLAKLEKQVVQHAAVLIANSQPTAARLAERYGQRDIGVLPNGVDWPATLPEKDWPHAGWHIVYAGSFFGWKGVADLVQAAAHLQGCHITLLGGTPEQVTREEALRPRGGAGATVDFQGHVPHAEVARALNYACIAVLPNRDDPDSRFTSPIKLYEYMAAGCAIVASDLPALRAAVPADAQDAVAWVKPGDPASLARGIRSLIDDPQKARAMSAKVRELARGLTWEARARGLAALLAPLQPEGARR